MKTITIIIAILFIPIFSHAQTADIKRAMRDEISRSLKELRLDGLQKPYYLEYRLLESQSFSVRASFGSLVESSDNVSKSLSVGIRVGSPEFDNTNFFDVGLSFFGSSDDEERFKNRRIPLELDYPTLRRQLWLATDAAYKQTAELYAKKESAIKNRIRLDTIPDFIGMSPATLSDTMPAPKFDTKYFESLCTELSGVFRAYKGIMLSVVNLEYLPKRSIYVNSEGREYVKTDLYCGLEVVAATQAKDGMPVAQTYTAFSKNPADLPSRDSLFKAVKELCGRLVETMNAPTLQSYSGPVLVEGQAAAEIVTQIFSPNLVTQRQPLTESNFQESARHSAFQNKIGGRVLPEFLSADVAPEKKNWDKTPLIGAYSVDDDGVPAESFTIVKNGYLKGLMSSRVPTKRVKVSNGHQRGGAAIMSVVEFSATSEKQLSSADLKKKMMQLCKDRELPFGIIIRKILNQNLLYTTLYQLTSGEFPFSRGESSISLLEVVKVFPDGREEVIRGVEAAGLSPQSFKDILAVGKSKFAYNYLASAVTSPFMTGGSQFLASSVITPDLLFEDLEIRQLEGNFAKPPILGHPFFSGK